MKKILVGTMTLLMCSTLALANGGDRIGVMNKKTKEKILLRCAHQTNSGEQCREFNAYLRKAGSETKLNRTPITVQDIVDRQVDQGNKKKLWPKRKASAAVFSAGADVFSTMGPVLQASSLPVFVIATAPPVATSISAAGAATYTAGGLVWVGEQGLNLLRLPIVAIQNGSAANKKAYNAGLQAMADGKFEEIRSKSFKKIKKFFEAYGEHSQLASSPAVSDRSQKHLVAGQVQLPGSNHGSTTTRSAQ